MKKYIIITSVALVAVSCAYAQSGEQKIDSMTKTGKPEVRTAPRSWVDDAREQITTPVITTGDAVIDRQIKVLQAEMETKIKAARDEYQAKLKLAIGNRKITISSPKPVPVSELRARGMVTGSTTSSSEGKDASMERKGDDRKEMEVEKMKEGETEGTRMSETSHKGGIRAFFERLFNR